MELEANHTCICNGSLECIEFDHLILCRIQLPVLEFLQIQGFWHKYWGWKQWKNDFLSKMYLLRIQPHISIVTAQESLFQNEFLKIGSDYSEE
jgi:hypothetical protein